MNSNIKNHLRVLIQLSIVDRKFKETEKKYVYIIGKSNNLSEKEMDDLVSEVLNSKENEQINFQGLLPEERFNYLYDVIQLMKVDRQVFLTEIKYCERVAEKLLYDKKVVRIMSARIYGDSSITGNRQMLMKEANKYLKK